MPGTAWFVWPEFSRYGPGVVIPRAGVLPELRETAPYSARLIAMEQAARVATNGAPDARLWAPLSAYSLRAMGEIADSVSSDPEEVERVLSAAGRLSPEAYQRLGRYFVQRGERDRGLGWLEKFVEQIEDRVFAMSSAYEVIDYRLDKGRFEEARKLAMEAGDVYSAAGLVARAWYHERRGEIAEAMEWLEKNEERYGDPRPLIRFCARQAPKNVGTHLATPILDTLERLRPKHLKAVVLADFKQPPADGVRVFRTSPATLAYGLSEGDVIVAAGGREVHTLQDYQRLLALQLGSDLTLIVWNGRSFREEKRPLGDSDLDLDLFTYKP
jgi:tetratricopeptide (TPR) repeat protein